MPEDAVPTETGYADAAWGETIGSGAEANAVFAIARAQRADTASARAAAVGALEAARLTRSGLPSHAALGLVDDIEPKLLAQLQRLSE